MKINVQKKMAHVRIICIGPGIGERCDGGSDEDDDESSKTEDSTGTKRRKSRVRGTIRGAKERQAFGLLEQVQVECQDDLVCVKVAEDRSVCQEENPNGKKNLGQVWSVLVRLCPLLNSGVLGINLSLTILL